MGEWTAEGIRRVGGAEGFEALPRRWAAQPCLVPGRGWLPELALEPCLYDATGSCRSLALAHHISFVVGIFVLGLGLWSTGV